MSDVFRAVKVTDRVYWVGAIDWGIRDFHGYATSRGTTYNAYLVIDEKVTLIDTVKAPFRSEMMARIASVIDPGKISVIVSNHSEMDHSGCLLETIDSVKPEVVYASTMGVKTLNAHFHHDRAITPVKTGDEISLGKTSLMFMETKMQHWPDSMVSYLVGENLLFSQDAFGMHLASHERFADQIDVNILEYEAGKYFANILLPYAGLIPKTVEKLRDLGQPVDIIAPDHGPVWRTAADITRIVENYLTWSEQRHSTKAVIVFDTMWQSTFLMARAIGEGLKDGGAHVRIMPMSSVHRSDVVTELLDAGAIIAGSPTLNNNMFPTMADMLTYLKGLKPKNLVGAAFGSYGWSGEGAKHIEEMLRSLNVEIVADMLNIEYIPDGAALTKCHEMGLKIAERLKQEQ